MRKKTYTQNDSTLAALILHSCEYSNSPTRVQHKTGGRVWYLQLPCYFVKMFNLTAKIRLDQRCDAFRWLTEFGYERFVSVEWNRGLEGVDRCYNGMDKLLTCWRINASNSQRYTGVGIIRNKWWMDENGGETFGIFLCSKCDMHIVALVSDISDSYYRHKPFSQVHSKLVFL